MTFQTVCILGIIFFAGFIVLNRPKRRIKYTQLRPPVRARWDSYEYLFPETWN